MLADKLWGSKEDLMATTNFINGTGLRIYSMIIETQKKKHKKTLTSNSLPVLPTSALSSSFPGTESGRSERPTWPVWLLRPVGFSGRRSAGNVDN